MPNERSTQLAKQILEDLRGSAYYADPEVLGGLLKGPQGTETDGERAAVEVLRYLLQTYAPRRPTDKEIQELGGVVERASTQ